MFNSRYVGIMEIMEVISITVSQLIVFSLAVYLIFNGACSIAEK